MRYVIVSFVFLMFSCAALAEETKTDAPVSSEKQNVWDEKRFETYAPHDLVGMGRRYLIGEGVEKNTELSERMFNFSFQKDTSLGFLIADFFHHDVVDIKKAIKWYRKSATVGDAISYRIIGEFYLFGEYVEQDFIKARHYFIKADDSISSELLGDMYLNGWGVNVDLSKAETWYLASAKHRRIAIFNKLAKLQLDGRLGQESPEIKALKWYLVGAYFGNAESQAGVEWMYFRLSIGDARIAKNMADEIIEKLSPAMKK